MNLSAPWKALVLAATAMVSQRGWGTELYPWFSFKFWPDHMEWIIAALFVLLVQAVAIAVLMLNRHRRLIKDYRAIKEDSDLQKRVTDATLQSKILIQKVIDASPDWIFVKDAENRFMLVNETFAKALDLHPEDLIGHRDTEFMPPELYEGDPRTGSLGLHDYDKAVFRGETVHLEREKIFLTGDKPRVFDTYKTPLRDAEQRIYGNLCYRRDITDRFNKEEQQQLLERQLQQAQKMELIGHLTGGIAHDFNNILASILGHTELIQMTSEATLSPQTNKYLREVLQAGIRGKELVQQLLTFSQKREAAATTIFAQPIVKEVVKLLQSTLPASIAIKIKLGKSLPQVLMSSVQLHQILMNLGINARDAISGTGTIDVFVDAARVQAPRHCESCHQSFEGNYLMISVRDTGVGIAPENRSRIFDPFFSTKPVGSGSGLGLSVLHGIVHSAEGHIELVTEPGSGADFRIYLPAHEPKADAHAPYPMPDSQGMHLSSRVMVVDDEAGIVGVLTALLEGSGCTVMGFTDASAALRAFHDASDDVDLVITDLSMPELSGVDLAQAMLEIRPDLPIIMCTGYSAVMDESMALKIGICRFLIKPVPATVILSAVAHCLGVKGCGNSGGTVDGGADGMQCETP
ncbi:MAG: response regulator [Rhodoferax sp.]|nr:response regulator [Rhodoferax sp.]